jgi:hypothetical protein
MLSFHHQGSRCPTFRELFEKLTDFFSATKSFFPRSPELNLTSGPNPVYQQQQHQHQQGEGLRRSRYLFNYQNS